MIATRFVPALCVLFALGLVPTLIHSYTPDRTTDGRVTTAVASTLAGYYGTPTDRNEAWGLRRFESRDWVERLYVQGVDQVQLAVVRSFDAKTLYHHPELAVAYGTMFDGTVIRRLEARPEIPIHELTPGPGVPARAAYVLHYGDRFIEDPLLFQVRTAGELLFSRRQPMTLFFAVDAEAPEGAELSTLGLLRVLLASIDSFFAQPPAAAPTP